MDHAATPLQNLQGAILSVHFLITLLSLNLRTKVPVQGTLGTLIYIPTELTVSPGEMVRHTGP